MAVVVLPQMSNALNKKTKEPIASVRRQVSTTSLIAVTEDTKFQIRNEKTESSR